MKDAEKVYGSIAAAGKTCDEIEALLGLSHQTVSARVRDLVKADRVYDTGERRATRSGRKAIVWAAKVPSKDDLIDMALRGEV